MTCRLIPSECLSSKEFVQSMLCDVLVTSCLAKKLWLISRKVLLLFNEATSRIRFLIPQYMCPVEAHISIIMFIFHINIPQTLIVYDHLSPAIKIN